MDKLLALTSGQDTLLVYGTVLMDDAAVDERGQQRRIRIVRPSDNAESLLIQLSRGGASLVVDLGTFATASFLENAIARNRAF